MKKLVIGILAHVDAGKTTLSESLLYHSGSIKKMGRVDNGNTFLDTYELERSRGITIFSKQAVFLLKNSQDMDNGNTNQSTENEQTQVTLLDTPGHVDFSAEMERTLQVLDYAILVISGADGIQGHTQTLWKLLKLYHIPVFIFINKMDQEGTCRETLLKELKKKLGDVCVDFMPDQDEDVFFENIAVCNENLLEQYLENGCIDETQISTLIRHREIFPCYFGSALKEEGVDEFLSGLGRYTRIPVYPEKFAARVFKITRDEQGNRLTHMKITGGNLKVKELIDVTPGRNSKQNSNNTMEKENRKMVEEKVNQIRIYSGTRYEAVNEVQAGTICAVTGLNQTFPGQGLGTEEQCWQPVLDPVLTYQILLPEGCDVHTTLSKLRQLEEEDPQLHIIWNERLGEIHAQLWGQVQLEVLRSLIQERFQIPVEFDAGNIVYKETIAEPVEGVGHYEPLRHYAEVHLVLEPGEPGSGLQFATTCSEDLLDRNWQRLILTHLAEKEHVGVLTGSPITDMKITLTAGRAHLKHTEGGDFRQSTYRAVRHGLKKAKSVLLEPWYQFTLEVPCEMIGRAMTDIQKMHGIFDQPLQDGEMSILTGKAPVVCMRDYQTEVISYSRGKGRLLCTSGGYAPCHNAEEVITSMGYDSEHDLENPTGSVFCTHGAGFVVDWYEVEDYMHLEPTLNTLKKKELEILSDSRSLEELEAQMILEQRRGVGGIGKNGAGKYSDNSSMYGSWEGDKELEAIFKRTYGSAKGKDSSGKKSKAGNHKSRTVYTPQGGSHDNGIDSGNSLNEKSGAGSNVVSGKNSGSDQNQKKKQPVQEEYLLVDGYNVIFAWDELKELADLSVDAARTVLMDILCNYQGYKKCELILVFDAYKVKGFSGEVQKYHNIQVVYTKEAETADQYIEKTVHKIAHNARVTVATSDGLEQVIILGQGAQRMSSKELKEEIQKTNTDIAKMCEEKRQSDKNYLFRHLDQETREYLEKIRLGEKNI